MRNSYNGYWIFDKDDNLIGLNLGFDFVAEHEWGIKPLRQFFGIPETKVQDIDEDSLMGFARHQIQKIPEFIQLKKLKKKASKEDNKLRSCLFLCHSSNVLKKLTSYPKKSTLKEREEKLFAENEMKIHPAPSCGWSGCDFGIFGIDDQDDKLIEELYEALKSKDFAILYGAMPYSFRANGLCFVIPSRIPQKVQDEYKQLDIENRDFLKMVDTVEQETQIREKLKKSGKRFYALSPNPVSEKTSNLTTFDYIYWLNPHEQRSYCAGWVTVEDVLAWAKNEGPIINRSGKEFGKITQHVKPGSYLDE